jgi:hypothetical protein
MLLTNIKDVRCTTLVTAVAVLIRSICTSDPTNKYSDIQTALLAASTMLVESPEFCAHSLDSTTLLTTCLMTMKVWVKPF